MSLCTGLFFFCGRIVSVVVGFCDVAPNGDEQDSRKGRAERGRGRGEGRRKSRAG